MRRYDELTDDQLLELTEEQIQDLIDLECAIEGVPLLPTAPVEPTPPIEPLDVVVYGAAGMYFEKEQDARDITAFINERLPVGVGYDYSTYGGTYYVDGSREAVAKVEPKRVLSRRAYEAVRAELIRYKGLKTAYDTAKKQYDGIASRREDAEGRVRAKVAVATEERQAAQQAQQVFLRYVKLADGDESLARRFMREALPEMAARIKIADRPEVIE